MCNFGTQQSAPTNQTTTQTTTASPQAQAMYGAAWQQAQEAAARPFQQYSTDPNAFVAPLNQIQTGAIQGLGGIAQSGQPYYQMAPGMVAGAGMTPASAGLGNYINPFMNQVVDPVRQAVQQQQAQQTQQLAGQQAAGGHFGNIRSDLVRAQLAGQQNLGLGQALSPLYQNAYTQALGASQADLQRQLQAGQALSPMGTQALQSVLAGGTLGQQTQQAGLQSLYNQFLMQQAYPFQTSQFLTQAATGLGPGYGGTTSGFQQTQTPLSFFGNPLSDPDLKVGADSSEEPEIIGETYDGQKIYRYRLIDPDTGQLGPPQIGLMADEAGEKNPDAVGDYKGFKTLDYAKATDDAARMGGGVTGEGDYSRGGYAKGGVKGNVSYSDDDFGSILQSQGSMYDDDKDLASKGLYGGAETFQPGAIPTAKIDAPSLKFAEPTKGGKSDLATGIEGLTGLAGLGKNLFNVGKEFMGPSEPTGVVGSSGDRSVPTFGKEDSGIDWMDIGSSALKALPSIVSAAAMFSDPDLKTGVRPGYQTVGAVPGTDESEDETPEDDDSFKEYDKFTARHEGGLNPNDVGKGPSMYGINQAAHPNIDVTKLSPQQAQDIRRKEYWEGVGAANLDPSIRGMAYDTAIMAGPRRAKQLLEISGQDPEKFMSAREKFLSNLVSSNPQKFNPSIQKAWAARNKELRETAGLGNADEVLANLPEGARDWRASTEGKTVNLDGAQPEGLSGFLRGKPAEGLGEKALDFATSEKFLIPLLQGLGGMASSGSRFFAPALLQGVGAGAKGYADLRQQEFERAKASDLLGLEARKVGATEREIGLKERILRQRTDAARALAAARKPLSQLPYSPTTPSDLTTPEEITKPLTPTQETPKVGAEAEVEKPIVAADETIKTKIPPEQTEFWKNVHPDRNPFLLEAQADQIQQQIADVAATGTFEQKDLEASYKYADSLRERAKNIWDSKVVPDMSGNLVPIPGSIELERARAAQTEEAKFAAGKPQRQYEMNKPVYEEAYKEAETARDVMRKTKTALSIMFDENGKPTIAGGPLAPAVTDTLAALRQFGVSQEKIDEIGQLAPFAATDPAKAQALRKVTNDMIGEVARQSLDGNKLFVSEFNKATGSVPNEAMLPESLKFVAEKLLIPRSQQVIDKFKYVKGLDRERMDLRDKLSDWEDEHPFEIKREPSSAGQLDALKAEKARRQQGLIGVRSAPKPVRKVYP
jgi:hypothetical protein